MSTTKIICCMTLSVVAGVGLAHLAPLARVIVWWLNGSGGSPL